jgi:hypothetical protein
MRRASVLINIVTYLCISLKGVTIDRYPQVSQVGDRHIAAVYVTYA